MRSIRRTLVALAAIGIALSVAAPATAKPRAKVVKKKPAPRKVVKKKKAAKAPVTVTYRRVLLGERHVYEAHGRYYDRVRHPRGHYYFVEIYPVGAEYVVLPRDHKRVVRNEVVVFQVGSAFFRPMFRNGRTTYIVVR